MLPVYMGTALGLSAYAVGWALASQYIGDNLFRSPLGLIIDRIGYRTVMFLGVIITLVAVLIISSTDQLWLIVAACVMLGIGTSPLWPCVITGATAVAGNEASGTVMSVVYMAWLIGVGAGPVVINFFIVNGFAPAFRLLIALMAAVVLMTLFLPGRNSTAGNPEEQKLEQRKRRREQRYARLPWTVRTIGYLGRVRKSLHASALLYPAMFLQTFALGLLIPVLTLFARTVLKLTPQQYSLYLIAGGAITVAGLIPVGKWVDRIGTKWFLHVGFLITGISLPLLGYSRDVTQALIIVAFVGLGYACVIPAWNALIAYAIPKEERGAVWGFFLTIEGSGTVLGSVLSGKLWDLFGPHAPFLISGFVLLLLFVLHLFISQRQKVVIR
jgi:MFS family permease